MKGIEIQTHIIGRQPIKVGPHCDRIFKTQVQPLNNNTISNGSALKKKRGA